MDLAQRKKEAEQKINDEWSKLENEKKRLDGKYIIPIIIPTSSCAMVRVTFEIAKNFS